MSNIENNQVNHSTANFETRFKNLFTYKSAVEYFLNGVISAIFTLIFVALGWLPLIGVIYVVALSVFYTMIGLYNLKLYYTLISIISIYCVFDIIYRSYYGL